MTSSSINKKDVRKFGAIAFTFFGCLCAISFLREKVILMYLFCVLSIFGFGLLLFPTPFQPLYLGWLKIAHAIGKIINLFLMSIAYYFLITPAAMMKRIFGGKPLPLKPDKNCSSYWIDRTEKAQPRERFTKRY